MYGNRSNHMARSKDELKRQLLMCLPKKPQPPKKVEKIQYQQMHPIHPSTSFQKSSDLSYTILDEFSKCPYLEGEEQSMNTNVLNMFMHPGHDNKKQKKYQFYSQYPQKINSTKVQASVQTFQKFQTYNLTNTSPLTVEKNQTFSTIQPLSRTPIKRQDNFNQQKSLINVSKNLSNCKYLPSNVKQKPAEQNFLTESILKSQKKETMEDKSNNKKNAQSFLEYYDLEDKKNDENEEIWNKPPIIKKIQLSRPQKGKELNLDKRGKFIDETSKDQSNFQDEEDQILNKVIAKKSSLKDLIKQKSSSSLNSKQKTGKWQNKIQKPKFKKTYSEESSEGQKSSDEIMNLFPPYESSSSTLEAVIEEQNQSLEDSVQLKKKISEKKCEKKSEYKNQGVKNQKNIDNSSELKQISLSDLSLQDVSEIQIQNRSQDKNFMNKSSLKKIPSQKKSTNKKLQKQSDNNDILFERYIYNDISKDVEILKKKMQSQIGQSSKQSYQDILQKFKGQKQSRSNYSSSFRNQKKRDSESLKKRGKEQANKCDGSEGVGRKQNSMLDFFEKINQQFDLQEISKDINHLKDRIESQSSSY